MAKKQAPKEKFSRREREIMEALYKLGEATAAQILEETPDPPTYTAIRTHLTILERKGHIRHRSEGTRYVYQPLVAREQMGRRAVENLLKTFYGNSIEKVVAALLPLLPRCAAMRHLVWLAVFGVLAALPLLALAVPSQFVLPQAAEAVPVGPVAPVAAAASHGWSMADVISIAILVWLLGIGFHLARLALGLFGLHRLRRNSVPFDGAEDVRLADDGPMAFGFLRPLILLPREADNWPLARLVAVLAHERAHLSRRDSLSQMLAQIVCAFYWPNLLLWLAARSMRREAEIAADNEVLAGGMRASDYAAELLQLAGQTLRLPALAMAAPSLEARVKSVLSPAPSREGVRGMDVFKIAWLGSAAAVALAFGRPAIAPAMAEVQSAPLAPIAPTIAPRAP